MSKKYSDTYLYSKYGDYEKKLFSFLMESEEIDKDSDLFADVKYEVKKQQVSNSLIKVLMSKNVILMIGKESLNKAFKVFMAKDIKRNKDMKCFIDCTDLIVKGKDGAYVYNKDGGCRVPGFVSKAVDTNGAGDSFWGGFLHKLVESGKRPEEVSGEELKEFARFGNAVASCCVEKRGAIPAMPSKEEVKERLCVI